MKSYRTVSLLFLLGLITASSAAHALSFAMPLQCDYGASCFIQNYVDADAGPDASDYRCGTLTYDGHKGTDFRLTDFAAMQRGAHVLAAANGTVLRVRNNAPDTGLEAGRAAIANAECGNGLVIAHADGFQTQYCHLKRGSIGVHAGDEVSTGAVLGEVGYSGETEFPHVHFQVSQHGRIIDPFNATHAACNAPVTSLWASPLRYIDGAILSAGFSDDVPLPDTLRAPRVGIEALPVSAPALIVWVSVMGAKKGDVVQIKISGPDGKTILEKSEPIAKSQATAFRYVGKKNRAPLAAGAYTGSITITRDGATIANRQITAAVTAH